MKDYSAEISAVYASLLGGLTYNGVAVPFYVGEQFGSTPDHFVVLLNIESTPDNNDQRFVSEVLVTLDVVTKQNMTNNWDPLDSIVDQILAALLPDPYVDRGTAFQIMIKDVSTAGVIRSQNGTININRKILIFNNHLTQKP